MTNNRKLAGVIVDWAGTTVDHGCFAPVRVLRRVFELHGVPISDDEARRDMGIFKRDHIQRLLLSPRVSERWIANTGRKPSEADVDALLAEFIPLQLECLVRDSAPIRGAADAISRLKNRGIKIGSTTGYTREMMDLLAPAAAEAGCRVDCVVTPDEVGGGRPHPWMIFHNAIRLQIDHLAEVVKIGDTVSDIEEGCNAGVWTIGVAGTGNLVGLMAGDLAALPVGEREAKLAHARAILSEAGAHLVIDSIADCEPKIDLIEQWIRDGRRPGDRP